MHIYMKGNINVTYIKGTYIYIYNIYMYIYVYIITNYNIQQQW